MVENVAVKLREWAGKVNFKNELEEAADQVRRREVPSPMQTTSMKPYMP